MKYSPKKKKMMRCSASAITTQIPSKEGDTKQLGDVVYQRPPINKISWINCWHTLTDKSAHAVKLSIFIKFPWYFPHLRKQTYKLLVLFKKTAGIYKITVCSSYSISFPSQNSKSTLLDPEFLSHLSRQSLWILLSSVIHPFYTFAVLFYDPSFISNSRKHLSWILTE